MTFHDWPREIDCVRDSARPKYGLTRFHVCYSKNCSCTVDNESTISLESEEKESVSTSPIPAGAKDLGLITDFSPFGPKLIVSGGRPLFAWRSPSYYIYASRVLFHVPRVDDSLRPYIMMIVRFVCSGCLEYFLLTLHLHEDYVLDGRPQDQCSL